MSAWGYVRATGDLDILVSPDRTNALKIMEVLREFGAPTKGVSAEDFAKPGTIYQMGVIPIRIDIITQVEGLSFEEARKTVVRSTLLGRTLPVISLDNLILNKSAIGRPKDDADVIELKKLRAGSKE